MFIAVTILLPRGIVGTAQHGWTALSDRRRAMRAEKGVIAESAAE